MEIYMAHNLLSYPLLIQDYEEMRRQSLSVIDNQSISRRIMQERRELQERCVQFGIDPAQPGTDRVSVVTIPPGMFKDGDTVNVKAYGTTSTMIMDCVWEEQLIYPPGFVAKTPTAPAAEKALPPGATRHPPLNARCLSLDGAADYMLGVRRG
jgi:hypothetical protein